MSGLLHLFITGLGTYRPPRFRQSRGRIVDLGDEVEIFYSPEVEFPKPGWILVAPTFDVGPDNRFLFIARDRGTEMTVNVTLNWFEELKELVPPSGSR